MGQVIDVVPIAVVDSKECLHITPGPLDRVRTSASTHIKATDRVVDGLVCVSVRFEVPVGRSAHQTASN